MFIQILNAPDFIYKYIQCKNERFVSFITPINWIYNKDHIILAIPYSATFLQ